jgi:HKD family nuclease
VVKKKFHFFTPINSTRFELGGIGLNSDAGWIVLRGWLKKWQWLGGNGSGDYGKADNVQTRSADCDSKTLGGLENGVLVTTCSNLGYNFSTMKRFLLLFVILFVPCSLHAQMLMGRDYYDVVKQHITSAKDSINIAMYFVIIDDKSDNPVNSLVDEVILAKQRGVNVKVVLEDGKFKENVQAYKKLRSSGVDVRFDTPANLLHLKAVVIDGRYVFCGSTNWSRAAIISNYEATSFYESVADAISLNNYIKAIPTQEGDIFLQKEEGVPMATTFLTVAGNGRKLLTAQADKQLDLYLLLLKEAKEKDVQTFTVDYEKLARAMGYQAPANLGTYNNAGHYYYERVHQAIEQLAKSKLVGYNKKVVSIRVGKGFIIPEKFYSDKYMAGLSMKAKYMYLICLQEATKSTKYPEWFRSQEDMGKMYGISSTTISEGLLELEKKSLIQVTRDKMKAPDFSDRNANVYRMMVI